MHTLYVNCTHFISGQQRVMGVTANATELGFYKSLHAKFALISQYSKDQIMKVDVACPRIFS